MKSKGIILGSRGSALALVQLEHIRALLHRAYPSLNVEVKIIKTSGDKKTKVSLVRSGIKGIFTKELEEALICRKIDVAIHSTKDMLTDLPQGLQLSAVAKREDVSDVIIMHPSTDSRAPTMIYTSSPRRTFQARILWPNAEFSEVRGNVETRLTKLAEGKPGEAILLAAAGLRRLNYLTQDAKEGTLNFDPSLPYRKLSVSEMIPAPGQGAIGLETRADDGEIIERLKVVNHPASWSSVCAERAFLNGIGGGCATPVGAYAVGDMQGFKLIAIAERKDKTVWRGEREGVLRDAGSMGKALAEECRSQAFA